MIEFSHEQTRSILTELLSDASVREVYLSSGFGKAALTTLVQEMLPLLLTGIVHAAAERKADFDARLLKAMTEPMMPPFLLNRDQV